MTDSRKKRMAMLDNLTAAKSPAPPTSMISSNRALRSARDAVDGHHVWELDPWAIEDHRIADRLDPTDIMDLRDAIEANGQTVPILVRRHPTDDQKYLLVYGRRRLEAIRGSDQVTKVRALVAQLDDQAAMRAQISENMARRDLTFIEKALFARELVDQGFGTQTQIAEILTVTKSAISMALNVVETVGPDLARAIGPAPGVGRPRWEALAQAVAQLPVAPEELIEVARSAHDAALNALKDGTGTEDPSRAAFEAVTAKATPPAPRSPAKTPENSTRELHLGGQRLGALRIGPKGLKLEIGDPDFARWLDSTLEETLQELHARYQKRSED